jgi:signal transduction histidine kinase
VAAVVVVCTAISFVVVYNDTGTQLRRQIDREIAGDLEELSQTVRTAAHRSAHSAAPMRQVAGAVSSYVRDQPFSASSTLQFAVVHGRRSSEAATATNRPELFGSNRPDDGEGVAEQQHENILSQRLLTVPDGYTTVSLPDIGALRLLKHSLTLSGDTHVVVGVGERLVSVSNAQRGVAEAFILASLLTLAGALAASYLIGTRFSRPLRNMAAVAARVNAGDLHPRIHGVGGGGGEEVAVLAESFNHMLDRLTDAFSSQRAFIADASHELRTPLTVIRGQLEVLAAQADPPSTEVRRVERLVGAEIARISRLVDDLLVLAKAEQTEFLRIEPIDLEPFVAELWDGVSLLAARHFELGPVPAGTLTADPDRLAQALRNLVSNAIEHTEPEHGLVRLDVEHLGGGVRFAVSDDGPGIPVDQRERIFDRFHRTDAARDRASGGTGLGLAIVRAIVEAHGGWVRAGASAVGGARIELELPRFVTAPHMAKDSPVVGPSLAQPRPV